MESAGFCSGFGIYVRQPLLKVGVVMLVKEKLQGMYHCCLSIILDLFIRNKGLHEPVHGFIRIGDQVARQHLFPPCIYHW